MSTQGLRQEKNRQDFFEATAPIRKKVLGAIKDAIKQSAMADPDMWPSVRSALEAILDHALNDVEHELERNLEKALYQRVTDSAAEGPKGSLLLAPWYGFRAFVLHHYLPHNKLVWGKLRDPIYLVMYLATFLPIHGVRVCIFAMVLLMLVFPGPPDEYQLINFILLCKGCQFLSTGFFQLLLGAMKYFFCYTVFRDSSQPAELMICIDNHGPGAHDGYGLALDYLGSIALVWVAFRLLPRSQKHAHDRIDMADSDTSELEVAEEKRRAANAGGRLRALMWYDRTCFLVSTVLALMLSLPDMWGLWEDGGFYAVVTELPGDPHFNANLFWCCVFYSLTSLPFFPFCISGLQEVMTHCYATGFNRHGACVAFETDAPAPPSNSVSKKKLEKRLSFFAPSVTRVVKVLEEGKKWRNGPADEWDYQRGDFGRGVWAMMRKSVRPTPSSSNALESSGADDNPPTRTTELWWGKSFMAREPSMEEGAEYIHLGIANVQIPAEHVDGDFQGSAAYCIEVMPAGGLDGEAVAEIESSELYSWFVVKLDADFDTLAESLGPRSQELPGTPFPRRPGFRRLVGEELEQRRLQLEQWLQCVIVNSASRSKWAIELTEFLKRHTWSQSDISAALAEPSGSTSTTLVKRLAHSSTGMPERSVPLGSCTSSGPVWRAQIDDIVAEGRQNRGGDKYGSYQFGDFSRGIVGKLKRGAELSSEQAASSGMPEMVPRDREYEQTEEGRARSDCHGVDEQEPQHRGYKFGDITRGVIAKLKKQEASQPSQHSAQPSSDPMAPDRSDSSSNVMSI